jgi:hypothetical protein
MFERFTERARKVVVLAQEEARHFNVDLDYTYAASGFTVTRTFRR